MHRTGDLNQSLDVDYAYLDYNTGYYDGYALNGIDFVSASPYPIHFEAGSATAELRLTTFREDEAEGSETTGVYLVENGSGYIVGTRTASATVYDPPVVTAEATTASVT